MSKFGDHSKAVYFISVAAELAGMHPQTLRGYERKGLVSPGRSAAGGRRYSEVDVQRLRHIQELTNEGLNLEGVRRVLDLELEVAALKAEIVRLAEDNEALNRQYRREIVPLSAVLAPWKARRT